MPLIGHANTLRKDDDKYQKAFHKTSRNLINKPRVLEKLSQVLSRHDINFVIIFGGTEDMKDKPGREHNDGDVVMNIPYQDVADILGIQWTAQQGNWLSKLKNSIVIIITGDSAGTNFKNAIADTQHALTPWIILHQIGEIFSVLFGFKWLDGILSKHVKSLESSSTQKAQEDLYHQLFKFGSVRTANKTGRRVGDVSQELVAEYLWHGKIRINQVEGVDSEAIKKEIEDYIKPRLRKMVGGIYRN